MFPRERNTVPSEKKKCFRLYIFFRKIKRKRITLTHGTRGITPTIKSGMGIYPTFIIGISKKWGDRKKPQQEKLPNTRYYRHFVSIEYLENGGS